MKVIDSFTFFNEFDIFKLRLLYLNDVVDYFIISESNYTHSGKPKPYYLDEIWNEIPKDIRRKIVRLKYEPNISQFNFPTDIVIGDYTNDNWKLERQQRDLISQNLSSFDPNDLFMVSDVDEIPRKEVIQELLESEEQDFCYVSACELFYYNFKTFALDNWGGTVFSTVKNAIEKGCDYFRTYRNNAFPPIKNAGWHFSYFGGVEQIKYKLSSYAHQEFNKDTYKDDQHIQKAIEEKKDLFVDQKDFREYNFYDFPKELQNLIIEIYPRDYYLSETTINVCFSTIPPRFEILDEVVGSYYSQTIKPNKIIITVCKNYHRFSYENIELESLTLKYPDFVELLFVENDYGPATKIYGALKSLEMYPNSYVMICDDDMIYDPKIIECYSKCVEVCNQSVWTSIGFNDILNIPDHPIWNLQGCNTYLFYPKLLEKFNIKNFEELYFDFVSKNANPSEVFLHDDYFISCILHDLQVPIRSFKLSDKVYQELPIPTQIHHLYKCHSDEIKLIQNIRRSYGELNTTIHCDYLDTNDQKVNECDISGELDVDQYHKFIGDILEKYKVFKVRIDAKTMNQLLDKKTSDIQEFYDWQIKYTQMPEEHIDYLFRLKYWNNFHPKVIYDIGSNFLSWYKLATNVWKDAKIYCVDAFSHFEDTYPRHGIEYAIELLSDKEEKVEFYENVTCPGLCTMYEVNEVYDRGKNFYNQNLHKTIRTTKTLDTLVQEKNWAQPDLIKIDVQGAEVDILKGAQETLQNCNHVILEAQSKVFSSGAPMLNEVEQYMNSIGFVLFQHIGFNGDQECDGDYHFVRQSALPHK